MSILFLHQQHTSRKKIKNKILVTCNFCKKIFQVWKSKFLLAQRKFNSHLYCSRKCSRKAQPPFYQNFYWCGKCKWTRKETAIVKKKGTINHYEYSKNIHLDKINLSKQTPLRCNNSILAVTVNDNDIVTKTPVYNKYKLKKDRYYCPKCDSLLTCRRPRKFRKNSI